VIIDPVTRGQKTYLFNSAPHGGGYDDIAFRGCQVFISASNPANNPNTGPAIVEAHLSNNRVQVAPVLLGDATAIDIPTGQSVQLNLQDPDSLTLDPAGDLVLTSQADHELILVVSPDTVGRQVLHLAVTYQAMSGPTPVEVDDTAFATSSTGFILFADKGANTVYRLTTNAFVPGTVYSSANSGPFVGTTDLTSGVITPIVTGVSNPGGLIFVDTSGNDTTVGTGKDECNGR
jgi:hypothetical protein